MLNQPIIAEGNETLPSEGTNRRHRERFPISCKILLTPFDQAGRLLRDEAVTVFGRDLSQSGICFSHDVPLDCPRFLLTFHASEYGEFVVEAEVAWSRMTAIGLYETGCRMVRKIVAPRVFL